ncbi:hypothetical protein BH09PLA1_BH09PLA1_08740 [soil metagenome]
MTQSSEQVNGVESTGEPTAGARPRTDRDLQRSALRELVELATECAAAESEIESRLVSTIAAAEHELAQTSTSLSQKLESLRQQIQKKHAERLAEANAQFEYEGRSVSETDQSARSRVAAEFESAEQEVKQKLDQAVWLAESVCEATQIQIRKEQAKAEEDYKAQVQQLVELDSKGYELLKLYGQEQDAIALEKPAEASQAPAPEQAAEALSVHREQVGQYLAELEHLRLPRLFIGLRPYLLAIMFCLIAMVIAQLLAGPSLATVTDLRSIDPQWRAIGYTLGGMIFALIGLGIGLRILGKSHVRGMYVPLQQSLSDARLAAKVSYNHTHRQLEAKYAHAVRKRDQEIKAARDLAAPHQQRATKLRDAGLSVAQQERARHLAKGQTRRDRAQTELDEWRHKSFADLQNRYDHDLGEAKARHDNLIAGARRDHESGSAALHKRWTDGLKRIQAPIGVHGDGRADETVAPHQWEDPAWKKWTPPSGFASAIPFGRLQVDVKQIATMVPANSRLELPKTFSLPALLAFPRQASLLIQSDRAGRSAAMRALEMVMTRLLTRVPAGRVRFTLIDPVGLGQNFAGFMHLADHDDQLVGGRIWTSQEHIDQRIADLTEHMETVIQKYLRNEFETIDDYNAQAGELAEPYRFLVIADFPVNFSQEAIQKLNSIASTGARCGVYTLIARDLRAPLPGGAHIYEIIAHSVNLLQQGDQLIWKDEVFEQFPLSIDPPPLEESLTSILNVVGRYAKDANRVEVPFANIAPKADQIWTGDANSELRVPIGRMGATRSQLLKLGRGVAQHALIAGKTGSGKSTLLHVLVTNLALWYHPDEVEFYLVDFKKGVEFKTYATHQLPHARAIAVESDREFGLSVLQRLDAELSRRGELYRKIGVQDLAAYREQSGLKMPRTLLIIDEFQEFFSEDDKLAQDAALLIDRLVRQGRAFGIHVLLGSQTIGGSGGLNRSTLGQMAVRIALQTSEADSQLILGDNNSAARLLSRPGEAIYNDQGGLVEGNSPFQVSWLPDEEREEFLIKAQKRAVETKVDSPEPVVFEGNSPADISRNRKLSAVLAENKWSATAGAAPTAWLGEPVAIKDPTAVSLRCQSGANVLIVGQQEEPAMAIMISSLISLSAQHAPDAAKFYVFDGTPADSPRAGSFHKLQAILPQKLELIEWRATDEAINALAEEMQKRQDNPDAHPVPIFAFIFGLQRYRSLRKQEESFSFSASEEEKKPKPDKQFADLLREGPALGIHLFTWADTPAAVDRTIDRASMREFDTRVLFQMSANDSSNLIDSPAANKLGFHRALAFSEEQGVLEKFRPYALPDKAWLDRARQQLANKR